MSRRRKVVFTVAAAVVLLDIAIATALSYYDSHTRKTLLALAAQELPTRASIADMEQFMRLHTARFALDDKYHHEYAGIVPQTRLDRLLFDRKVQVVLKLKEDRTFQSAEVRVYYTAL